MADTLANILANFGYRSGTMPIEEVQSRLRNSLADKQQQRQSPGILERAAVDPYAPFDKTQRPDEVRATPERSPGQDALSAVMFLANFLGPGVRPPRFTLSRNLRPNDENYKFDFDLPSSAQTFTHRIMDNGERIGSASGHVLGDTAYISWLGRHGVPSDLGLQGIRQLREDFRGFYPEVTTFTGSRISGARRGPASTVETPDTQTVKIPAWPFLVGGSASLANLLSQSEPQSP